MKPRYPLSGGQPARLRAMAAPVALLVLASSGSAQALEWKASGRAMFGAALRTEAPDPRLLVSFNAAQVGLAGQASSGQNTDDANLNFARGEPTSRALRGYLDLTAGAGGFFALVRVKAWHDFALENHARPWGNNANGYAAGKALSDAGAARLSRFSGVALGEAFLQRDFKIAGARVMARLGQQSLAWGEGVAFPGGLGAINGNDQPAMRRAGVSPQEMRVPTPMLFARADFGSGIAAEGFYSSTFRPSALDMCGTFWATTDYLAQGCDRAFAGPPALSDRERLASGSFLKRIDSPSPNDGAQFGVALTWKSAALASDFALHAARTIWRTPIPGLRKSTRAGPAFIAGDPDGRNLAFFTEYPDDVKMLALSAAHKRGATLLSGELAYRPNQPLQLPPGDVLPPFLSPAAPSLLRADANATVPGGYVRGYDRYRTAQLQVGLQHDWGKRGLAIWSGAADVIAKHAFSLPDPALRRYGRPDQFGAGPVNGKCTVNTVDAARQCSLDGYISPSAYAYRLRVIARMAALPPELSAIASVLFQHDVKGWSHDFLLSEGRKTMNLALRLEYRKRYLAEVVYAPVWGGLYSNQSDKDQVSMAVGLKF